MDWVRLEWGPRAIDVFRAWADIVVVVDVLSFSTSVDVAVSRGAAVLPCAADRAAAERLGEESGACVAVPRGEMSETRPYSLSPGSLDELPACATIVLPSPNGAALTAVLASAGPVTVVGCLRNATAVGAYVAGAGSKIGVLAAGERWPSDRSLRPAFEDLVGAGAVIAAIGAARRSPEAAAAAAVYADTAGELSERLADCTSGRELQARGYGSDVDWAAAVDVSASVPLLVGDRYVAAVRGCVVNAVSPGRRPT